MIRQKCYAILYKRKEGITLARKDVDMTQGNILKHYLAFAAPLAVGLLFQQLYNVWMPPSSAISARRTHWAR